MLSRALSLAAVALLLGCFAAGEAAAQNLEAGKSAPQLFSSTCALCHKSSRGLLKTVTPRALPGFLRQHYTTSSDMAGMLSAYVLSNGGGAPGPAEREERGRRTREANKPEAAEPERKPEAAPSHEQRAPQDDAKQKAAKSKRDKDKAKAAAAKDEHKPEPKSQAKHENKDAGQPETPSAESAGTESPKTESSKSEAIGSEAAKTEPADADAAKADSSKPDKAEPPKAESAKSESAKSESAKTEPAKTDDAPKVEPAKPDSAGSSKDGAGVATRPDPVPAVTPAPSGADPVKPAGSEAAETLPAQKSAEGASTSSAMPVFVKPDEDVATKPAVAPEPRRAPSGPPIPPISR